MLGGNAVDAAIATNAAIAVTCPHLCGLGGDLFALVHVDGEIFALNSTGRAAAGADAAAMRAEGHTEMPFRLDIRAVTVPGCVDGWMALHERFGTLPLDVLLEPAIALAAAGFAASPLLVGAAARTDEGASANLVELISQLTRPGARVRRVGVARTLEAIAAGGRAAFYEGEFGAGLKALGNGFYGDADLTTPIAEWVTPLTTQAFGVDLWTIPPNSQGYLTLGASALASQLDLPADPTDPLFAHLLIEAATAAGFDRPDALSHTADGDELLRRISGRLELIDTERASDRWAPARDGDTTYLCTVDGNGMGVSLIQSNAAGFGSGLVEQSTGINLHNRGLGFNLLEGHPAELKPGHRPPHTLCPAMATTDGSLRAVFGTMGGDAQPQILLQVAARLFHYGQSPAAAIDAGRWALQGPSTGFDTWTSGQAPSVAIEGQAPDDWMTELARRGHKVELRPSYDSGFGHAHAIVIDAEGFRAAAADPRTMVGTAAGI
ncbi:MAG: gamma-glutamyltranspeptidase / glutathione hydrolase [Ilumatobacteraceae bacterium]|nr:gamma-glutamyltranspeptidase / glutathione hydrolase [Ilumatobacteraceae bacterium]